MEPLQLTVYRQASKARPDGTIVYKGEDTLPYLGENVFLVADGMGGAAAIRHQKFDKDMFDEEKIFDVLFKDLFNMEYPEIKDYVKKAFRELFAVKDCYFDNSLNMKKGGYFGSRIATALFLYWVEEIGDQLFSNIDTLTNRKASLEDKQKVLDDYSERATSMMKEMLGKVSENANLIYETSLSGMALLGTTICATVYSEKKKFVDAFYFVAGDSRPYMWDEDNGLCQVVPDQERADGGMTNYIKANGEFVINCEFHRFEKPCILFNASDGIFDSGYFRLSQMALEKLLLEMILESKDMEEAGRKLDEIFLTYGTHDDSSTIALKCFGYDDLDDLKKAIRKRLKKMEKDYLFKMDDLLTYDHIGEWKAVKAEEELRKKKIANALWQDETLRERFTESVSKDLEEEKKKNGLFNLEQETNRGDAFLKEKKQALLDLIGQKFDERKDSLKEVLRELWSSQEKDWRATIIDTLQTSVKEIADAANEEIRKVSEDCAEVYKEPETPVETPEIKLEDEARRRWDLLCAEQENLLGYALSAELISKEGFDRYTEMFPVADEAKALGIKAMAEKQEAILAPYEENYERLIRRR